MRFSLDSCVLLAVAVAFCVGVAPLSHAQSPEALLDSPLVRNAVYLELGGSGIFYSLNYSRRLGPRTIGRIGATWFPFSWGIPASVSYLFGTGQWRPEFGVGLLAGTRESYPTLFRDTETRGLVAAVGPITGYRYQPRDRGVFFRVALQPLAVMDRLDSSGVGVGVWGGVSVGWAF
ncbi:MAG: hypothetical protein ABEL04_06280 [Salinibacter sp.]|uniref:hypothetical protein n=1 Tax=Salinibacter sp. TaxID=2065818 RepID=UPI0035D49003